LLAQAALSSALWTAQIITSFGSHHFEPPPRGMLHDRVAGSVNAKSREALLPGAVRIKSRGLKRELPLSGRQPSLVSPVAVEIAAARDIWVPAQSRTVAPT